MSNDLFGEPLSEPLNEPLKEIVAKLCSRSVPIKEILSLTGISKVTYYNYINDDGVKQAIKSFRENGIDLQETIEIAKGLNKKNTGVKKNVYLMSMLEKSKEILKKALDRGDEKIALEIFKIYRPKIDEGFAQKVVENVSNQANEKDASTIKGLASFARLYGGNNELRETANG